MQTSWNAEGCLPLRARELLGAEPEDERCHVLYFVPHQDDELLTLGVALARAARYDAASVVLCTDGKNCETRLWLGNGESCDDLKDSHVYPLEVEEYGHLRDVEFAAACRALGVREDAIHIPDDRMVDGRATVVQAKQIMTQWIERYPQAKVCTHIPIDLPGGVPDMSLSEDQAAEYLGSCDDPNKDAYGCGVSWPLEHVVPDGDGFQWARQHPDHAALGLAALEFLEEGAISELELFVEPYHLGQFLAKNPKAPLFVRCAAQNEADALRAAIDQYCLWDPEKKRYALGFHSARKELVSLRKRLFSYSIRLTSADGGGLTVGSLFCEQAKEAAHSFAVVAALQCSCDSLEQELAECKAELAQSKADVVQCNAELAELRGSWSFRVGSALVRIPGKARRLFSRQDVSL